MELKIPAGSLYAICLFAAIFVFTVAASRLMKPRVPPNVPILQFSTSHAKDVQRYLKNGADVMKEGYNRVSAVLQLHPPEPY